MAARGSKRGNQNGWPNPRSLVARGLVGGGAMLLAIALQGFATTAKNWGSVVPASDAVVDQAAMMIGWTMIAIGLAME